MLRRPFIPSAVCLGLACAAGCATTTPPTATASLAASSAASVEAPPRTTSATPVVEDASLGQRDFPKGDRRSNVRGPAADIRS
jgi:hypothetical protein